MKYETIRWKNNCVELIDQRILPQKLKYVKCNTAKDIFDAIKKMKIRGAPAIGIAGAFGVYLGIRKSKTKDFLKFTREIKKSVSLLSRSRPTARNLFWALEKMESAAAKHKNKSIEIIKNILLKEAQKILEDDNKICKQIGKNGKVLIKKGCNLLTHCNAGGLATASYGTALGVVFSSKKNIKIVYVDETRPRLQGAILTGWELSKNKIPVKIICDNMAASLMAKGKIDAVVVGADRISANGDTANKIGTYNVAVIAKYHKIPFYVAAPVSTFDLFLKSGKEIPIEQREKDEVRLIRGRSITVKNIDVENPSFDVTPAKLVKAIITEKGIIRKPDRKRIAKILGK